MEEARAKDAWGAGQRRRGVQGIGVQGGRRRWRLGVLAVGGVGAREPMRSGVARADEAANGRHKERRKEENKIK